MNSFAIKQTNRTPWKRAAWPLAFLLCAGLAASADTGPTAAPDTGFSGGDPAGSSSRVYQEGNAWVQEITGSLPAPHVLKVESDAGSVQVRGAAQSNLTYVIRKRAKAASEEEARKMFANFRVQASSQGGVALLRGQCESCYGRMQAKVDFDVTTPRATATVNAQTGGGSVSVTGIAGTVAVETGGGTIRLDDITGPATASSGGGSIELGTMGGDVAVETGGGTIHINSAGGRVAATSGGGSIEVVSARQAVSAETGGGSIRVQKCGAELKMETGGGSLEVGEAGGAVTANTGGGSIRVWSAKGKVQAGSGGGSIHLTGLSHGVNVETGAGGIVVEFANGASLTDSALETSSGDVTVYLPPNVGVTVHGAIEAGSKNSVRSDFGELHVVSDSGQWGPHEVLVEGKVNGGGPMLKIRTTTGKIEVLRANK